MPIAKPIAVGLPTQNMNSNSGESRELTKRRDVLKNRSPNRPSRFPL